MCGIVGYIGKNCVEKNLIKDLKLLEYRGYDSAGVAVLSGKEINVTKSVGCIKNLEDKIITIENASQGIAHTRWATHGEATENNAHPHLSNNKNWAVVHNGIIENYAELKKDLIEKGFSFNSETDTEVVSQMLEYYQSNSPIQTLVNVCDKLKGSFALAVINKENENSLYLAKRKSPLYVCKTQNEVFIASDPICFAGKSQEYYALNDDEFCEVSLSSIKFFNDKSDEIGKVKLKLENFTTEVNKANFDHYMIKEIYETPSVLKRIVKTYEESDVF